MIIDVKNYKKALEKELGVLETDLKGVARKNPSNPNDWEPTPVAKDVDSADENDVATEMEEFEDNAAVTKQLEIQYNEVRAALERITNGVYGKCEKCGREIEKGRLDANPAARTCMACMEK